MSQPNRQVRVVEKIQETPEICSLILEDPVGAALPPFTAGAHIDLHLGEGLTRQYSLCNDPKDVRRYQLGVRLDPVSRGGSKAVHGLVEGDMISISEPRNHFGLVEGAHHSVLIAGGIGVTPLLSMAHHLDANAQSFEMHYATRSAQHTAFHSAIGYGSFADRVWFYHDEEANTPRLDLALVLERCQKQRDHLYVCGPSGFIAWVLAHARSEGWPEAQLHTEYFAGSVAGDATRDQDFEVQIASTGQVISVSAKQSVVSALASEGISVPVSCEQGVCGTCVTRILNGTPDHRDMYLTPDEQASGTLFTPCCSRAKGLRLVLDL